MALPTSPLLSPPPSPLLSLLSRPSPRVSWNHDPPDPSKISPRQVALLPPLSTHKIHTMLCPERERQTFGVVLRTGRSKTVQRRDGLQALDLGARRGRDTPPMGSRCGAGERCSTCGNPAQGGLAALRVPTGGVVLGTVEEKGRVGEWEAAGERGEWASWRPIERKP